MAELQNQRTVWIVPLLPTSSREDPVSSTLPSPRILQFPWSLRAAAAPACRALEKRALKGTSQPAQSKIAHYIPAHVSLGAYVLAFRWTISAQKPAVRCQHSVSESVHNVSDALPPPCARIHGASQEQ
eukprot:3691773-Rhodomonas_salina.3